MDVPRLGMMSGEGLFLDFYLKMMSCRAFWVAINYSLAFSFTQILPVLRAELKSIDNGSSTLGIVITPSGKLRARKIASKHYKNAPKLLNTAQKLRKLFVKHLWLVDLGHSIPPTTPLSVLSGLEFYMIYLVPLSALLMTSVPPTRSVLASGWTRWTV